MIIYYNPKLNMIGQGWENGTIFCGNDEDGDPITLSDSPDWIGVCSEEKIVTNYLSSVNSMTSMSVRKFYHRYSEYFLEQKITQAMIQNWFKKHWKLASIFGTIGRNGTTIIEIPHFFPPTLITKRLPDFSVIEKSIVAEILLTRGPTSIKTFNSMRIGKGINIAGALVEMDRAGLVSKTPSGNEVIVYPTKLLTGIPV